MYLYLYIHLVLVVEGSGERGSRFSVSLAQHHGKSFREGRKAGRPRGKVRTSGEPVQGLLQDCE